ncbi:THAP domain-containing protein 1-like [Megalopta genalis]|uniref:THAP domain-containing protein 1-like n=1 Tax=Megalopta genalis TaxID=115081 RepID=UPI003FD4E769
MSYCIVYQCSNRSANKRKNWEQEEKEKDGKFSFHLLPKDTDRRNKWLEALGLKDWCPPKSAAVCSAHFEEQDYETHATLRKLKVDAFPHVNLPSKEVIENAQKIKTEFPPAGNEICATAHNVKRVPNIVHQSTRIFPKNVINPSSIIRSKKCHIEQYKSVRKRLYDANYKIKEAKRNIHNLKTVLVKLLQQDRTIKDYDYTSQT